MTEKVRFMSIRIRPLNGNLQYFPVLQAKILNFRVWADTGHPTNSLRYVWRRAEKRPGLAVPQLHLEEKWTPKMGK
jgi:hypothetical protein